MAITEQLRPSLMLGNGFDVTSGVPTNAQGGVGVREFPYTYVFDATGLTDATSPTNLVLPIQGDGAFALRRMFGLSKVASKIQLRQFNGRRYQSTLAALPDNYVLPREIIFPADGAISIDLGTVLKANLACGSDPIYTSYLGFQGVKYLPDYTGSYETPFEYKRLPYTFTYALTIDWDYYTTAPTQTPPRPQYLPLTDYDFELHAIRVRFSDYTLDTTGYWQIILYDAYERATSNLPVNINYFNESAANLNSVFPVPGLLYPAESQIRFDVRSLICPGTGPRSYVVEFVGMQRYPLNK